VVEHGGAGEGGGVHGAVEEAVEQAAARLLAKVPRGPAPEGGQGGAEGLGGQVPQGGVLGGGGRRRGIPEDLGGLGRGDPHRRLQGRGHLGGGGVAPLAVLAQGLGDHLGEGGGKGRVERAQGDRRIAEYGARHLQEVAAGEGEAAGQQVEEQDADREQVRAAVHVLAPELLGGGEARGGEHDAGLGLHQVAPLDPGDAEVGHLEPAVRQQHQVGRLHVPVDDAAAVGGFQGAQQVEHQGDGALGRELPLFLDHPLQGLPLQPFHGDVRSALLLADPVEGGGAGMGEGGHRPRLLEEAEPVLAGGLGLHAGQHLRVE
jgi:hypothetical protein